MLHGRQRMYSKEPVPCRLFSMSLRYFHLHEYIFTAVSVLLIAWFAVVFGINSTSIVQRVIARGEAAGAIHLRYECF